MGGKASCQKRAGDKDKARCLTYNLRRCIAAIYNKEHKRCRAVNWESASSPSSLMSASSRGIDIANACRGGVAILSVAIAAMERHDLNETKYSYGQWFC